MTNDRTTKGCVLNEDFLNKYEDYYNACDDIAETTAFSEEEISDRWVSQISEREDAKFREERSKKDTAFLELIKKLPEPYCLLKVEDFKKSPVPYEKIKKLFQDQGKDVVPFERGLQIKEEYQKETRLKLIVLLLKG